MRFLAYIRVQVPATYSTAVYGSYFTGIRKIEKSIIHGSFRYMGKQLIHFIFYGNYFIGLIAVALTVETCYQLQLPLPGWLYFLLLFFLTVFYYTYAYARHAFKSTLPNPRTEWYRQHQRLVKCCQIIALTLSLLSCICLAISNRNKIGSLSFPDGAIILLMLSTAGLYDGILSPSFLNLRHTGWMKSFIIGFVWAGCVSLVPIILSRLRYGYPASYSYTAIGYFIQNGMFCTVNAIMFDMKDYAEDSNLQLRTVVVRMGLRRSIHRILMPLILAGLIAFLVSSYIRQVSLVSLCFNLLPFLLLLVIAYSLHRRKSLLYYLVIIDGLLVIKAICGILGAVLSK